MPVALIPQPTSLRAGGPRGHEVRPGAALTVPSSLRAAASALLHDLVRDGGPALRLDDGGAIEAIVDPARAREEPAAGLRLGAEGADEGYRLTVRPEGIRILAATDVGAFRGLTTLRQLLALASPGADGSILIEAVEIEDRPRFAWRSLLLDVARHYYSVAEVCEVIDLLALYKFNAMQLHLVDNEAWRIEIDGHPELTAATPERYTRDDLAAIVAHAALRHIQIIPDIDLPGHCAAFIRARPDLGVLVHTGERDVAYADPDADGLWDLLREIYRQLLDITGSPVIHIGGDEAFRMPDDQYGVFVRRALQLVRDLDALPIAFQEGSRAGFGPDDVAQVWIDFAGPGGDLDKLEALAAAGQPLPAGMPARILPFYRTAAGDLARAQEQGAGILVSPTRVAYFDTPHAEPSLDETQTMRRPHLGLDVYSPRTLREFYEWDPATAFAGLRPERIAGVEATMWADTITDTEEMQLLLTTRLPGFAERAWSPAEEGVWDEYRDRLSLHPRIWSARGIGFYRSALVDWS